MPGPPGHQHRTPFWYRHSYHQPDVLQYYAPCEYIQAGVPNKNILRESRFNRQRVRPNSISDMEYSLESSPTSSVPSKSSLTSPTPKSSFSGSPTSKSSFSGSGTDTTSSSVLRSESQTSSEMSPLDQSCSSLPSHSGGSSNNSNDQDMAETQVPVWKRNGKFVAFFRSFMSPKGREKTTNTARVFGTELSKLLADTGDEVPQVVRICSQFLEERGIIDGIYRAPGISSNIHRIKNLFDEQRVPNLAGDTAVLQDIHSVASALKLYFRDLPTPLVTYDLYPHLVIASKHSEAKRCERFREILQRLPAAHYRTMDCLMKHLHRMSQMSSATGMNSKNLAIVWSPNILRCDVSELDTQDALQDVGLQAVITEFLIRFAALVFAPAPTQHPNNNHCVHCCCQCSNKHNHNNNNNSHTVTFSNNVTTLEETTPALKPAIRQQVDSNKNKTEIFISGNQTSLIKCGQHAAAAANDDDDDDEGFRAVDPVMERGGRGGRPEARVNVISRPRPRSVAVPNPATSGQYSLEEVKLVSLPAKQTAELVDVKGEGVVRPAAAVTFHTVLERPAGAADRRADLKARRSGNWKNIFNNFNRSYHEIRGSQKEIRGSQKEIRGSQREIRGSQREIRGSQREIRGSHREINIDEAILPENKPINFRPRPKSELNLSYSVQDSTLMLTPVKNNEFQVTTTNQFSYLPYQQHLLNYNNTTSTSTKLQPFARTSKLRQNFGKKSGNRPKSVDFEVLKSVENICRAQPIVYGPPSLLEAGGPPGLDFSQLRASQRERIKDRVGEWQSVHATRV